MDPVIIRRNHVKAFGAGKQPMLFAHGFGCDQNMWRFVTPAFEDDYRIVLMDYVGCGRSERSTYNPERYSNLNGYAQDILDVCRALELRDVILVGHSVSSMTCLLAALKEPGLVSGIIFIGPSPRYLNDPPNYFGGFERKDIEELLVTMDKNYIGWANFLAPAVMKNPDRPELAEELTSSFCSTDPKVARNFAEATFFSDNRGDLLKLTAPSLILQCSDDLIAPVCVGEYMQTNIPNSTYRLMNATGHCPHMSAPEETIGLMKEYLASLEQSSR